MIESLSMAHVLRGCAYRRARPRLRNERPDRSLPVN